MSDKGPDGASITLSEGAYCLTDGATCRPSGTELGDAALGPLDGTLYKTTDGYAIVVAAGENPGWAMTTRGLTQETTIALGAALAQVGSWRLTACESRGSRQGRSRPRCRRAGSGT